MLGKRQASDPVRTHNSMCANKQSVCPGEDEKTTKEKRRARAAYKPASKQQGRASLPGCVVGVLRREEDRPGVALERAAFPAGRFPAGGLLEPLIRQGRELRGLQWLCAGQQRDGRWAEAVRPDSAQTSQMGHAPCTRLLALFYRATQGLSRTKPGTARQRKPHLPTTVVPHQRVCLTASVPSSCDPWGSSRRETMPPIPSGCLAARCFARPCEVNRAPPPRGAQPG